MSNGNGYILEAKGLTKLYGPVIALNNVDFELKRGEILGLLGDNGAGKSTLIKILSGAIVPNKGEIYFEGSPADIKQPRDAFNLGIETIYQDLALFDNLDFTKNIFVGREYVSKGAGKVLAFADTKRMRKEALVKIKNISINLPDLSQKVETMSGGQRQAVAITRSIFWGKKVIIMDEPLAALGVQESKKVLDLIKETIKHVQGIIVITHNIDHILKIVDRVIVLRHGERAGDLDCSNAEARKEELHHKIVSMITGAV
ncbi:MAG: ATP-binding cassette domain-containing protein [Actinobacteria bacterium]|nr:ATP-binding cassette domain-containing protein [Actinomycetota bacterium]